MKAILLKDDFDNGRTHQLKTEDSPQYPWGYNCTLCA
jgi:hypothetical protein